MPIQVEIQRWLLDAADEIAAAAAGDSSIVTRLEELRVFLTERRLRIGIVGEFGNGKSTVANSLLGEALLPMGAAPVSHLLGVVTRGPGAAANLNFKDGVRLSALPQDLWNIGDADANRLNDLDLESPSEFLDSTTLIDTPGIGESKELSERVERAIPTFDAVIFVLNCDRLLSMSEREFISEKLLPNGPSTLCFVLNRADGKTTEDVAALMERARHILEPVAPGAPIFPYSALQVLQGQSKKELAKEKEGDPAGLREFLRGEWLARTASIQRGSSIRKLNLLAAEVETKLDAAASDAAERLQEKERELSSQQEQAARLEETLQDACRKASTGIQAIQEQLGVGLKDFALTLREKVPDQVMDVQVDHARRFLPFYVQDNLKRAVDENAAGVRSAITEVIGRLPEEAREVLQQLTAEFDSGIEPPAIPLYLSRERASMSQGAAMLMLAGTFLLLTDTWYGCAVLLSGCMSREVGQNLEAADRRANLAASAQLLIHGSIELMEQSLQERFSDLEEAMALALKAAFEPASRSAAAELEETKSSLAVASIAERDAAERAASGRSHLRAALDILESVGVPDSGDPPLPTPRRKSRARREA